ncbi:AAA family ATPase [Undibacterium sp. Di27W]|uniref:AAA family ATPase n=1 Tax=Undibacterium sp. Di27W TaxID=3413036 RepID=UPI003BF4E4E7
MNSRHQPKRDYKSIGFRLIYTLMLMIYLTSVFEFDRAIWSASRIDGIIRHYALAIVVTGLSVLPGVFFIKLFAVRHVPHLALAGLTTVAQLFLVVFCLSIEIAGALYFSLLFCFGCVFLIGFKWINYEVVMSRPHQTSQHVMVPVTQNEHVGHVGEGKDHLYQVKFIAKRPRENFKCIHGMSELKKRLFNAASEIVWQYNESARHHPQQKGNTFSASSSKAARNGILLFGEPGNGKTYFVQALAGELGLPLISITYGDVASKWVNDTTQNVVKVFQDARAQAPCLLFLDEIDSFIQNRDCPPGGAEEVNKTTNTILTEIVDLRSHGVVLVGATNYFDKLDKAAIREGRFDYKIEITPPDEEVRYEILIDSFHQYIEEGSYCPDIIRKVTQRWEGFSVKRIQAVGEEVAAMSVEDQIYIIDSHILKVALRRVQGRKGQLPENTKSLDQLILPKKLRQQLNNIATRMKDFEIVDSLGEQYLLDYFSLVHRVPEKQKLHVPWPRRLIMPSSARQGMIC